MGHLGTLVAARTFWIKKPLGNKSIVCYTCRHCNHTCTAAGPTAFHSTEAQAVNCIQSVLEVTRSGCYNVASSVFWKMLETDVCT